MQQAGSHICVCVHVCSQYRGLAGQQQTEAAGGYTAGAITGEEGLKEESIRSGDRMVAMSLSEKVQLDNRPNSPRSDGACDASVQLCVRVCVFVCAGLRVPTRSWRKWSAQ